MCHMFQHEIFGGLIPFPESSASECDDNVNLRLQIAVMKGDLTALRAILKCSEEQTIVNAANTDANAVLGTAGTRFNKKNW